MYERTIEELNKLAAQVDSLEIESSAAASDLEAEVKKVLDEKEIHIAQFLSQMADVVKAAKFPVFEGFTVLCCGTDWEGKPGACGSHQRDIGLCFRQTSNTNIVRVWFGRWFSGAVSIDEIMTLGDNGKFCHAANVQATYLRVRDAVLTRWNDETEQIIRKRVLSEVRKQLTKRIRYAVEELQAANQRYADFCEKEKEGEG